MSRALKHRSVRLRLTLTYAAVLLVTCAALLALNYALLYHSLYTRIGAPTVPPSAVVADDPAADPENDEKLKALRAEQA